MWSAFRLIGLLARCPHCDSGNLILVYEMRLIIHVSEVLPNSVILNESQSRINECHWKPQIQKVPLATEHSIFIADTTIKAITRVCLV